MSSKTVQKTASAKKSPSPKPSSRLAARPERARTKRKPGAGLAPDATPEPAPAPLAGAQREPAPAAPTGAPAPTERLSGLDAAYLVLREAGAPMRPVDVLAQVLAKGLWKTRGRTPEQTLSAGITREIARQGEASRFLRAGRGLFTAAV